MIASSVTGGPSQEGHVEIYMDNAGYVHIFVLNAQDEILYFGHDHGEAAAWEWATEAARDPEAWLGWDADWKSWDLDAAADLRECREFAAEGKGGVRAWEPCIDPAQRVSFWTNDVDGHAFIGFAAVASASPVASHEAHITYDVNKGIFRGEEIGPDGWIDLGQEEALDVARDNGFEEFVGAWKCSEILAEMASEKGKPLFAGDAMKMVCQLEESGRMKPVPVKAELSRTPERAERQARSQVKDAPVKERPAKSPAR